MKKTLVSLAALSLTAALSTGCATQSQSLLPTHLSSEQQNTFHEIAKVVPNPCAEEHLTQYQDLDALLIAGKTCHEAHILSSDIQFYLTNGFETLQIQGLAKTEARALITPVDIRLDNRPRLGQPTAPVEIVVFSDFQCPFCARAAQAMHKVQQARPDAVTVVFKQMPLTTIHPYAAAAALVSTYAQAQGKFWQIHDKLFENQASITPAYLTQILEDLGTTPDDLFDPAKGQPYGIIVMEDIEDAQKAGVRGTPSFYVNGVSIEGGGNYERMIAYVDAILSAPAPASEEAKQKARARALENCPYPGHEEIYALLPPNARADLSMYANSVLCPCPNTASTLHDCTIAKTCPAAAPLIDKIITRIMEKTPQDQIQSEIDALVQQERTKM